MSSLWLKQSTAKVISFGPFVDQGDGVSLEVGLVSAIDHATTGILLSKNGGALTIRHQNVTASTYDAYGNYLVTLDTTDTNTLGTLRMQFAAAATNVPVWQDFMVMPANVYDSLVSGSAADLLDVSAVQLNGTALTAQIIAAIVKFFDKASPTGTVNSLPDAVPGAAGGGFIAGTNAATSVTTALTTTFTGNLTGSVASVANIAPTGTGLTAVPWNPAWDAEVQSEVTDALDAEAAGMVLP
jgi:hypothetical protein